MSTEGLGAPKAIVPATRVPHSTNTTIPERRRNIMFVPSLQHPELPHNLPHDTHVLADNGRIAWVGRLQYRRFPLALAQPLDRVLLAVHPSHDDIAVVGVVLRADEEKVTVVDAQADHAVTAHPNGESRLSNYFPGHRDVFFWTLHHEGRMASVHVSIYRQNC